MGLMNKGKTVWGLAAGLLFLASFVASEVLAVNLDWVSKTCVVVDGTFHVCKPSDSWDTQKTKGSRDEAVRWVLHRQGANPIIKLVYKSDVQGQTAHDYAKWVSKELELRGLKVTRTENRVVNGRNVSLINATDPESEGKLNYLVAVYRDRNKGLQMECTAGKDDFTFFAQEFMSAINSVRFQ